MKSTFFWRAGWFLVCGAIAQSLAGCHSSQGTGQAAAAEAATAPAVLPIDEPPDETMPDDETPDDATPEGPPEPAKHGYFAGSVFFEGSSGPEGYYAEALLTIDGHFRFFIWGVPGIVARWVSPHFVGTLEFTGDEAHGHGVMYGSCVADDSEMPCRNNEPAELTITTATRSELLGDITLAGDEKWQLRMSWPTTTYLVPATLEFASGLYSEWFSEFGTVNVDTAGRIFAQSPQSGCITNGSLVPHGDGTFNVYDVDVRIENCVSFYEGQNGEFTGLASRSIGDAGWGDWLLMWLSTKESASEPKAVLVWAERSGD